MVLPHQVGEYVVATFKKPLEQSRGFFYTHIQQTIRPFYSVLSHSSVRTLITILVAGLTIGITAQTSTIEVMKQFRDQKFKSLRSLPFNQLPLLKDTTTAITDILYIFGTDESQLLTLDYHQRLSEKLTFNLQHITSSGNGSLVNDNFRVTNSRGQLGFRSTRFSNQLHGEYFRNGRSLNGGLATDTNFVQNGFDQNLLQVNLNNNSSEYTRAIAADTMFIELDTNLVWTFAPTVWYLNEDRNYSGSGLSDSNFFEQILITEPESMDYYRNRRLLLGGMLFKKVGAMILGVGGAYEYQHYYNRVNFIQNGAAASFSAEGSGLISTLTYHLEGFRKGGAELDLRYTANIDTAKTIVLKVCSERIRPDYFFTNYSGNHFSWEYPVSELPFTNNISVGFADQASDFQATASAFVSRNYLFFDSLVRPNQAESANYFSLSAAKQFKLGSLSVPVKWNSNLFQSEVIRLPQIDVSAGLFANLKLFKKKMNVELGLNANWFSSYYANAFEPSTGITYLQDSVKVGGFPYLDVALKSTVSGASFFLMFTHVNENLTGRNYYFRPGYLELGRRFLFGLTWRFIN